MELLLHIERVLWVVSLVTEVFVVVRLFREGLLRQYPLFAIYLTVEVAFGVLAIQVNLLSWSYAEVFRTHTLAIALFLRALPRHRKIPFRSCYLSSSYRWNPGHLDFQTRPSNSVGVSPNDSHYRQTLPRRDLRWSIPAYLDLPPLFTKRRTAISAERPESLEDHHDLFRSEWRGKLRHSSDGWWFKSGSTDQHCYACRRYRVLHSLDSAHAALWRRTSLVPAALSL